MIRRKKNLTNFSFRTRYIHIFSINEGRQPFFSPVESSLPVLQTYSELFAIAQMDFSIANILKFFQRLLPASAPLPPSMLYWIYSREKYNFTSTGNQTRIIEQENSFVLIKPFVVCIYECMCVLCCMLCYAYMYVRVFRNNLCVSYFCGLMISHLSLLNIYKKELFNNT